jgi:hypothetical protein
MTEHEITIVATKHYIAETPSQALSWALDEIPMGWHLEIRKLHSNCKYVSNYVKGERPCNGCSNYSRWEPK